MNIQEKRESVNDFEIQDAILQYAKDGWNAEKIKEILQGKKKSGQSVCDGHCGACSRMCPRHMMENPEKVAKLNKRRRTKDEIYPGMRMALRCGVLPPKLVKATVEYLDDVSIMSMLYEDGHLTHFKANAWGTERYCKRAESIIKDAVKAGQEHFKYCALATMTYDTKRTDEDIIAAWERFGTRIGKLLKNARKKFGLRYVAVREPTARGFPHVHVLFFSEIPIFKNHDNMKGGHEIHHGKFYTWLKKQNEYDIVNLKVLKGNGVGVYVSKYITKGLAGKCRQLVQEQRKYSKEEMKTLLDFIIFPVTGKRKFTMSEEIRGYAEQRKASFRDDERDLCNALERASSLHSVLAVGVRRLSVHGVAERIGKMRWNVRQENRGGDGKAGEGGKQEISEDVGRGNEEELRYGLKLWSLAERHRLLFEVFDGLLHNDGTGHFLVDWARADTPRKRRIVLIQYCIKSPIKCGKRVFISNPKSHFGKERWQEMVKNQDFKDLEEWLKKNTDTITCGGCFLSHFSNWVMNGADVYFSRVNPEWLEDKHKPYCGFSLWDLDDESFEKWVNYSLKWRLKKIEREGENFESIHDFEDVNYFGIGQFRRTLQSFEMTA